MMMKHLLWKDVTAIRPLFFAILAGIFGAFVICGFASAWATPASITTWYGAFWILMPNLVALGAPAVLIGTEEENGTLSWLRTLPVPWAVVANSKFLVGLGTVLLTWCISSAMMYAARITFATSATPTVAEWTSAAGVAYLLVFSLLLLTCGFLTGFLFKSPVTGLVTVVPLITLLNVLFMKGYSAAIDRQTYRQDFASIGGWDFLILTLGGLALVLVLWAIQLLFARRRLTAPDRSPKASLIQATPTSAYQPPRFITTRRPSTWRALLWQQQRQVAWSAGALTLLCAGLLLIQDRTHDDLRFITELSPILVWLCVCWIGGLAFYGDNVRRRVDFFADRGISATQVWISRLLLPTGLSIFLLLLSSRTPRSAVDGTTWLVIIWLGFGFGQLVGQWVRRPVLTFFAAPALATVAGFVFVLVFSFYSDYLLLGMLATPVLLFASWRLASRWINRRVDFGYHWRVVAYAALAIAIPLGCLVANRVATTPRIDLAWRQQVTQRVVSPDESNAAWISPIAFSPIGTGSDFESLSEEEVLRRLQLELDSESIGENLAFDEVLSLLGDADSELTQQSIAVLLKWARSIREQCVVGNADFNLLETAAEKSEWQAVRHLDAIAGAQPSPQMADLIRSIPDRDLRSRSRRAAMIDEWNRYQQGSWRDATGTVVPKGFMNDLVGYRVFQFGFERKRADRYVDEMTKLMLNQLDNGLPKMGTPSMEQRNVLYRELCGPGFDMQGYRQLGCCNNWTVDYERQISALRSRLD